ncbi:MAG: sigma-54-dependent Fis family transcriptional regulator [Nevskiaceae bacterium]|nr:MAG: sigma-54-dependent Fis family transcriptional regulator [Nevskiaceae bacterium]TBR73582.1 MAG: sigma-54-dependent Fis family transcriptional regulator [Nevskiaceae bacterium]
MSQPSPIRCVLIVDDEPDLRALVGITLRRMGLQSEAAATLAQARQQLAAGHFDLCLTDMRLPDGDGIDLVRDIQHHHPQLPVAVITAYGSAQTAVESLKAGAFDFVCKPLRVDALRKLVADALRLAQDTARAPHDGTPQLIGDSPALQALRTLIARVARSQAPVHITGESGTGKELVARLIHAQSPRAGAAFVAVSCGALPAQRIEAELFGGTDASGLLHAAEGGTLFLDEVAELPPHVQVQLLRTLQERSVRAVGTNTDTPVNVRIISATHENLAARVTAGQFRQDLYYRLNVIEAHMPALREHAGDIPQLAPALLARIAARAGVVAPRLAPDALSALSRHPFPGNVRELENVLERTLALCDHQRIAARDLALRPTCAVETPQLPDPARSARPAAPTGAPTTADAPLDTRVADVERAAITAALDRTHWNRTRAAQLLGITFRQLRYRLKKLGIE